VRRCCDENSAGFDIVPVGLEVGRQADVTVLLEVAAEGILFHLTVSISKYRGDHGFNIPECRDADRKNEAWRRCWRVVVVAGREAGL